jgi:hypothetical protein
MKQPPHGRQNKFADADLRSDLEAGLKPRQIAEKYACSPNAVYKRINSLQLTTTAALVAPVESQRFVNRQLDVMEQLNFNLRRVNLLMDACDDWLRDAKDPQRYDIGARSEEVMVTFFEMPDEEGKTKKAKAPLRELLARVERGGLETSKAEGRIADPRSLILSTLAESRQIMSLAVDLAKMLADAESMERFREAMLDEIRKVSPDVAQNIAKAVRRSVLLFQGVGGHAGVPAAGSLSDPE